MIYVSSPEEIQFLKSDSVKLFFFLNGKPAIYELVYWDNPLKLLRAIYIGKNINNILDSQK